MSSNQTVAQRLFRSSIGKFYEITFQNHASNDCPRVAFELGRARHYFFVVIANDVDDRVCAQLLRAFFEGYHRRQEGPIARFLIGFAKRIGLAIRYIAAEIR